MSKLLIEFNNDRPILEIVSVDTWYLDGGYLVVTSKDGDKTYIKESLIDIFEYNK